MTIRFVTVEESAATGRFPGSTVRHGTHSGWTRHIKAKERPCDPCYRAKEDYDKRRRAAPEQTRLNRLHARAQGRALRALAHKYPDEYRALYVAYRAELMAEYRAESSTHNAAPWVEQEAG